MKLGPVEMIMLRSASIVFSLSLLIHSSLPSPSVARRRMLSAIHVISLKPHSLKHKKHVGTVLATISE